MTLSCWVIQFSHTSVSLPVKWGIDPLKPCLVHVSMPVLPAPLRGERQSTQVDQVATHASHTPGHQLSLFTVGPHLALSSGAQGPKQSQELSYAPLCIPLLCHIPPRPPHPASLCAASLCRPWDHRVPAVFPPFPFPTTALPPGPGSWIGWIYWSCHPRVFTAECNSQGMREAEDILKFPTKCLLLHYCYLPLNESSHEACGNIPTLRMRKPRLRVVGKGGHRASVMPGSGYTRRSIWSPSSRNICYFKKHLCFTKSWQTQWQHSWLPLKVEVWNILCRKSFSCAARSSLACSMLCSEIRQQHISLIYFGGWRTATAPQVSSLSSSLLVPIRECPGSHCQLARGPQCHFWILNRTFALNTQVQMPRTGSRKMLSSPRALVPAA